MRTLNVCVFAVTMAFAGVASADTVTNIYTVTTQSEGDYKTPFLLDDMIVTCTDTAGGVEVQKSFAELAANGFGPCSVFRKRGAGWLQSSVKMATFKGEINVEEGGFIVTTNLMTGAQNYDEAPIVRVLSGATFMLRTTTATCPNNKLTLYNKFNLAGEGFNGMGAICNASENSQYNTPYAASWYLEDNIKVYHVSSARWDMGDLTGTGHSYIDMNGHDLKYVRNRSYSRANWCFSVGAKILNPGNIYIDGQIFSFQQSGDFQGDSGNCLVFTNGSKLVMYKMQSNIPWSVKFYGDSTFSCNDYPSGLEYPNINAFSGPVAVNDGSLRICTDNAGKVRGTTFSDDLTGEGNIIVDNCWLQLINGGKTMTGQITVDGTTASTNYSGLAFWSPESVPMSCVKIAFTNTQMRLMDSLDMNWDFPQLDFHVASGTNSLPEGVVGGSIAGLRKTGPGMIVVPSPFSVTGVTEISEGILKIGRYGNAGLYCGRFLAAVTPVYFPPLDESVAYWNIVHGYDVEFTNRVDLSLNAFNSATDSFWYAPAGDTTSKYVAITYAGYIWNRSRTTQRWTFAGAGGMHTTVRLDGEELYWFTTFNEGKKATVDVAPGPHKVYFSTANALGSGGPKGSSFANMNWKINGNSAGVMYDPEGKDSETATDYMYMVDPGDGSLFTQSTNETVAINAVPSFHTVKMGENGTFDTFGNSLTIDTIVGVAGTFTNSNPYAVCPTVFVTNSWCFSSSEMESQNHLRVHVPVSFAPVARISVDVVGNLKDGEYEILTADNPITGCPAIEKSEWSHNLSVRKSSDGRSLYLICQKGFRLIVR